MSPARKRLASLFVLLLIIVLAVGISSALYFFKTERNEEYQNRLHLRELKTVADSLVSNLAQFKRMSTVLNEAYSNVDKTRGDKSKHALEEYQNILQRAKESYALRNLTDYTMQARCYVPGVQIQHDTSHDSYHIISKRCRGRSYIAPLEDFFPRHLLMFPLVLVADEEGHIVARKDYLENSTETHELGFVNLQDILYQAGFDAVLQSRNASQFLNSEVAKAHFNTLEHQYEPAHSVILDTTLGGVNYRLFIQPVNAFLHQQKGTQFIVGFVPAGEFQLNKLRISADSGILLLIAVLLLLSFIPFIKIRFLGKTQNYTKVDIIGLLVGGGLFMGGCTLAVNHLLYGPSMDDTKLQQARLLLLSLKDSFEKEVQQTVSLSGTLHARVVEPNDNAETCTFSEVDANERRNIVGGKIRVFNCVERELTHAFTGQSTFLESAFLSDATGLLKLEPLQSNGTTDNQNPLWQRYPVLRPSEKNKNFSDFWIGQRDYFQRASRGNVWHFHDSSPSPNPNPDPDTTTESANRLVDTTETSPSHGFIIERIKNLTDGRLSSQFAFPVIDNTQTNPTNPSFNVLGIGSRLRTFFHPVMPADFGYAVLDQDGKVLYHTDNDRVLVENFLVETNDDPHVRSLLNSNIDTPVAFSSVYRNAQHLMVVADIHDAIPWKLVVFYNTQPSHNVKFWLFVVSLFIFLQLMLVLLLYSWWASYRPVWLHVFSFSDVNQSSYARSASILMASTLWFFMAQGVVIDLLLRIGIWAISAALLLFSIIKRHNKEDSWWHSSGYDIPFYRHIFFPFLVLGCATLVVYGAVLLQSDTPGLSDNVHFGSQHMVPFIVGGVILLVCLLWPKLPESWRVSLHTVTKHRYIRSTNRLAYPASYILFLAGMAWFFIVVPAILIGNTANHVFIDYLAGKDYAYITQECDNANAEMKGYLRAFGFELSDATTLCSTHSTPTAEQIWPAITDQTSRPDYLLDSFSANQPDWLMQQALKLPALSTSFEPDFLDFISRQNSHYSNWDVGGFQLHSLLTRWHITFMLAPLLFLMTYLLTKHIIAHRLLGEHLFMRICPGGQTDSGLGGSACDKDAQRSWCKHLSLLTSTQPSLRIQLIRSERASLKQCLEKEKIKVMDIDGKSLFAIEDILETRADDFLFIKQVEKAQRTIGRDLVVLIEGLDELFARKAARSSALALLMALDRIADIHVVLVCEMSLLYRLTHQQAYPHVPTEAAADGDEQVRWSMLLAKFQKIYAWVPGTKTRLEPTASVKEVLEHERQGWRELDAHFVQFCLLHLDMKLTPLTGNNKQSYSQIAASFASSLDADKLKEIAPQQVIDFFGSRAGTLYRNKWQLCTTAERVLLIQLAQGGIPNPANEDTLEYLVKRGYLYRAQGWFFVNESFRKFVLTAERDDDVNDWVSDLNVGTWAYLRIPVFVLLLVLVGFFMLSSGQSIESILATLTASLGLIPVVLRNLNIFRSGES